MKKILMLVLTMLVVTGCSQEPQFENGDSNKSDTMQKETIVDITDGEPWVYNGSLGEAELEETKDIFFVNDTFDMTENKIEATLSKLYYEEEGLFVELNITNGKNDLVDTISIDKFSLIELLEEEEENTEITIAENLKIGEFNNLNLSSGHNTIVSFVIPDEYLLADAFNFKTMSYLIEISVGV
ncbi:hypothetical protein J3A84_05565 [Proteiniclasticum sp. SCR006]|uniref:Uncharacterized protein n=1 Tax=Proteiniclasticum aestuarii TaxID=2817862 RepID=A0A939KFI8_9CLOT|nr:hypothetical protein [Proteiniclasticum aestuarii]MBO1264507.1 hypothetical protein [Proteiniclasticum aestuarii]